MLFFQYSNNGEKDFGWRIELLAFCTGDFCFEHMQDSKCEHEAETMQSYINKR